MTIQVLGLLLIHCEIMQLHEIQNLEGMAHGGAFVEQTCIVSKPSKDLLTCRGIYEEEVAASAMARSGLDLLPFFGVTSQRLSIFWACALHWPSIPVLSPRVR